MALTAPGDVPTTRCRAEEGIVMDTWQDAMKPRYVAVPLIHLVKTIDDEFSVCGTTFNHGSTSPLPVTCPSCKRILMAGTAPDNSPAGGQ